MDQLLRAQTVTQDIAKFSCHLIKSLEIVQRLKRSSLKAPTPFSACGMGGDQASQSLNSSFFPFCLQNEKQVAAKRSPRLGDPGDVHEPAAESTSAGSASAT